MGSTGTAIAEVRYTANTVFFLPQVDSNWGSLTIKDAHGMIEASNIQVCQIGQRCTVKDDQGSNVITKATKGEPSYLQCNNATNQKVDIGIGFSDSTGRYNISHSVVFKDVNATYTVSAKLIPTLKIYETSKYHKSDIIKGDVDSPQLWSQDLMALGEETTLEVSVDPVGGQSIIQVLHTS